MLQMQAKAKKNVPRKQWSLQSFHSWQLPCRLRNFAQTCAWFAQLCAKLRMRSASLRKIPKRRRITVFTMAHSTTHITLRRGGELGVMSFPNVEAATVAELRAPQLASRRPKSPSTLSNRREAILCCWGAMYSSFHLLFTSRSSSVFNWCGILKEFRRQSTLDDHNFWGAKNSSKIAKKN